MSLKARQLAYARGDRLLFSDLTVEVGQGEALWVCGPNGAGKTSLLKLLCGLARPTHGQVLWHDRDIRKLREDYHHDLLYLGHAHALKDDLRVWENVLLGARLAGQHCSYDQALEALDAVGLLEVAQLPGQVLSQGQRRRVGLARLWLAGVPPLWILDEPFNALDHATAGMVGSHLGRHLEGGGLLVYTTHLPVDLPAAKVHRLDLSPVTAPC